MAESRKPTLKWNPWKVYDVSEKELRTIKERAKMRAAMKEEFMRKSTNPYHVRVEGHVFDPAVQRHMAMRATESYFFKPNMKTICVGMLSYVIPVAFIIYYGNKMIADFDKKCATGEITYKDRKYRYQ